MPWELWTVKGHAEVLHRQGFWDSRTSLPNLRNLNSWELTELGVWASGAPRQGLPHLPDHRYALKIVWNTCQIIMTMIIMIARRARRSPPAGLFEDYAPYVLRLIIFAPSMLRLVLAPLVFRVRGCSGFDSRSEQLESRGSSSKCSIHNYKITPCTQICDFVLTTIKRRLFKVLTRTLSVHGASSQTGGVRECSWDTPLAENIMHRLLGSPLYSRFNVGYTLTHHLQHVSSSSLRFQSPKPTLRRGCKGYATIILCKIVSAYRIMANCLHYISLLPDRHWRAAQPQGRPHEVRSPRSAHLVFTMK